MRFGTDGVRGRAGESPIDTAGARAVGGAACRFAQALGGRKVVVGHDTRVSSPRLARDVGEAVVEAGGTWLDAGTVPTSAVALAVESGLATVGVIVTASHNPAGDNGFKVVGAGGRKLDEAGIAAMEAWLAEPLESVEGGVRVDASASVADLWRRQVEAAVPQPNPLEGRRIAVDLANGASTRAVPWLEEVLGAELHLVGTTGVINDGCGSEHLGAVAEAVLQHDCDAGLAVDGDGDRCRLVDGDGRPVPGDAVLWLLARALDVPGLAVTVMSNGALEAQLPGVRVVRTAVGDRFVRAAMDEQGLPLGGEESGHILFAGSAAGDGLVAGVRALVAAFEGHDSLAEAVAGFRPLARATGKVPVARRPALEQVDALRAAREAAEPRLGSHGRVFLRYSGTEPVLRILVEGAADVVGDVAETIAGVARRVLGGEPGSREPE